MRKISLLFVALYSVCSFAAEMYPKRIPDRFFGSDQGPVGSCSSEAEVGALEQAFENRGYSVRLSTFYRHAYSWMKSKPEDLANHPELVYSAEDRKILAATGSLIPEYMWPEDGEGYDLRQTGKVRPSVSEQAVIDPSFPTAESLGFKRQYFDYVAPDAKGLADIKAAVAAGNAVTLAIQGDVLYLFDSYTGLMKEPYKSDSPAVKKVLASENNHAVAVVGFDDALQAFVIRNSWNNPLYKTTITNARISPARAEALKLFRYKVFSEKNLPGYFALPYAYVNDVIAKHESGYRVLSIDYDAYAAAYFKFKNRYKIVYTPFSCDRQMVERAVGAYANSLNMMNSRLSNSDGVEFARKQLLAIADSEVRRIPGDYVFSYAKIAVNKTIPGIDHVRDFYDGRFFDYYCGNSQTRWPSPEFNKARAIMKDIDVVLGTLKSKNGFNGPWMQWFNQLALLKEKGYSL